VNFKILTQELSTAIFEGPDDFIGQKMKNNFKIQKT
jgi:hypothetical protein